MSNYKIKAENSSTLQKVARRGFFVSPKIINFIDSIDTILLMTALNS